VEGTVDRDGGFLLEVLAQVGVELVHGLDDAAQVPGLDGEFAHAAGVAAAETRGEDNPRGPRQRDSRPIFRAIPVGDHRGG
jgi:hypothetical protein